MRMELLLSFVSLLVVQSGDAKERIGTRLNLEPGRQVAAATTNGLTEILLIHNQKTIARVPVDGVTAKKPAVELKSVPSNIPGYRFVEASFSPTTDENEIMQEMIFAIGAQAIIAGPKFNSIGVGEGGVYREFDYSLFKTSRQVRLLISVEPGEVTERKLKVIRRESGPDGPMPLVIEETHTWTGSGFQQKVEYRP